MTESPPSLSPFTVRAGAQQVRLDGTLWNATAGGASAEAWLKCHNYKHYFLFSSPMIGRHMIEIISIHPACLTVMP